MTNKNGLIVASRDKEFSKINYTDASFCHSISRSIENVFDDSYRISLRLCFILITHLSTHSHEK
jgi:hypothetical protein